MKIDEGSPRLFYALLPVAIVAILYAFSVASTLILWVICSFFLFALIDPWMQKLMGKGINPILLAVALVCIAFAILTGMGFLVYKTSSGIIVRLISYKSSIFKLYEDANHYLAHWSQLFSHPQSDPGIALDTPHALQVVPAPTPVGTPVPTSPSAISPSEVGTGVLSGLNSVLSVLTYLTLTPLLTFFIVAERDQFGMVAKQAFHQPERGRVIWKQITDAINAYFLGNIVLIVISFPIFVVAFALLHVKSFLSLGLLSAVVNLVPFLGFILAAILPTLDLLTNDGSLGGVLVLLAVCLVTHFTIANVITPKLLGAKLDINATFSTIALIGFGELWGPIGLLLAIPVTALLKILLQHSSLSAFRSIAALMSEDPKSLQKQGMDLVSAKLKMKKK